jgi:hypothetical protein
MSGIILGQMSQEDANYDGFFDGQNIIIPEGTELNFAVIDGFVGIEEGKSQNVCMINIAITSPGEFFGQKYRYNAKVFDIDANKRDLAMRNLGVLDAQAGHPMTNGQLELTTETIVNCWAGISEARVKFGLFVSEDDGREYNFVRGFGYLREKMVQAGQHGVHQEIDQKDPDSGQQTTTEEDDIGF